MDKEKQFYEQAYLNWLKQNQRHARELERENAELVFKPDEIDE